MTRYMMISSAIIGLAGPVQAAESLVCTFTQECVGESGCSFDDPISMRFQARGDVWVMQGAQGTGMGTAISFTKLAGKSESMRSFLAENADPAASAVSVLSIFEEGQAFMSTHGIFLTPGFVTHIGTCVQKGN